MTDTLGVPPPKGGIQHLETTMKKKTLAALGEKLIRQGFADPASFKLAKGFQSIHQDGARDREQERQTLSNLNLKDITLANFKVTRRENLLILTYTAAGQETIDGQSTSTEPAYRLSVFIQAGKDWELLAHANLLPMTKTQA